MFLNKLRNLSELIWVFSGRLGKALFMLFLNVYVAKRFGVEEYADFVLLLSFYVPSMFLTNLGYSYYFNRFSVVSSDDFSGVFSWALFLTFFTNVFVVGLLCYYLGGSPYWLFFMFFFSSATILVSETYRGFGDIRKSALTASVIPSCVSFFAVFFAENISDVVSVLGVGSFAGFIISYYWNPGRFIGWPKYKAAVVSLREALPLIGINFSMLLAPQMLLWALSGYGTAVLASIGLATRFIFVLSLPIWVVNAVSPKRVHDLLNKGAVTAYVSKIRRLLIIAVAILGGVFLIVGQKVIIWFFGDGFDYAYTMTACMLVIVFMQAATALSQIIMNVKGMGRSLLKLQGALILLMGGGMFFIVGLVDWLFLVWLYVVYQMVLAVWLWYASEKVKNNENI